ncbi:L-iditol 2-dehydrogenase [Sphingobium chlorophenolicum L-1]|uniref:L-iditol 2-dehydrogenase n=1 Tax=Sphingobium chlorophenolicum L-1 TaxID=690566 RepID=F6EUG3_SPHCR|nr:zinc-binding dehydrogenase [Sphingobium chlorophenolicum]AEG47857.1 L-iditol 2-dehydrogenase [Sphingobium chlorophenolicum L-1]
MKAVVKRQNELVLQDIEDPIPAVGQTLVKTLVCGICGSDLHQLHHLEHVVSAYRRIGVNDWIDPQKDLVFGHEYCAEILDHGPGSQSRLKPGTRVVAMPFLNVGGKTEWIGISNLVPGGFAEQMVLQEALLLPVPNGLSSEHAALVEPMAVGVHAVAKAKLEAATPALVIGCGPIGLAVIAALKLAGHGPIIASDFSSVRRKAAEQMGADLIIDPASESPHVHWDAIGVAPDLAVQGMWNAMGRASRPSVVFECVGVPGMIQNLVETAPPGTQIVIAGACLEPDSFEPVLAMAKQIEMRFVLAYSPQEFADSLHALAEGRINATPMITGTVALDGVADAFVRLANPDADIKLMVRHEQ